MKRSEYKYRARLVNGPRGWIYMATKPGNGFRLQFVGVQPCNSRVPMPKWNTDISERRLKDVQRNPHFRKAKP